jgi:hypothetical protein
MQAKRGVDVQLYYSLNDTKGGGVVNTMPYILVQLPAKEACFVYSIVSTLALKNSQCVGTGITFLKCQKQSAHEAVQRPPFHTKVKNV